MKLFFVYSILFFALSGCGQNYNSNSGDYSQYAPIEGIDSTTPDGARLLAAYKIFQTKCFQCHEWSSYKTSEQWITAGKVSKGNSSASTLYTKLKNNGGNMPPDTVAELTSDELQSVESWINQIP